MLSNHPLVIISCDAFRETWPPFMRLWDKFGGGRGQQVFLITESASFAARPDVKVVHPRAAEYQGSSDWIGMVASGLRQIDAEYLYFTLDDFFLKGPIDWARIDSYARVAVRNGCDTVTLGVHDTTRRGRDVGLGELLEVEATSPYWLTTSPALWKRSSLLSVLGNRHGSAWQFEYSRREDLGLELRQYMVDRKSMFLTPVWPYYAEFWAGVDTTPVLSDSAIAKGKWQRGMPAFLAHHGIDGVAFWKRGFHAYYPPALAGAPLIRLKILFELLTDIAIRPQLRGKAWAALVARANRALGRRSEHS
jgi:hypothetical protein